MSDEQKNPALEWADGDGFSILTGRFYGDGPLMIRDDPRDILVDAYNALVPPLAACIASLEAERDGLAAQNGR